MSVLNRVVRSRMSADHAHRVRRDTGLIVFSDITLTTRFHPKCLGDKSHRGNVFIVTVLKPECVQS